MKLATSAPVTPSKTRTCGPPLATATVMMSATVTANVVDQMRSGSTAGTPGMGSTMCPCPSLDSFGSMTPEAMHYTTNKPCPTCGVIEQWDLSEGLGVTHFCEHVAYQV